MDAIKKVTDEVMHILKTLNGDKGAVFHIASLNDPITERVSLGVVGQSDKQIVPTDSDRDTWFVLSCHCTPCGQWLQFKGEWPYV